MVLLPCAAADARETGDKDSEILAQWIRAKALLLSGDLTGAQSVLSQAQILASGIELPGATRDASSYCCPIQAHRCPY
jgi:hypothetical protein